MLQSTVHVLSGAIGILLVKRLCSSAPTVPLERKTSRGEARPAEGSGAPAALVLVAKLPVAGSSKTRLIPSLGPDGAANLSQASLLDLLHRFATFKPASDIRLQRVLLFAPPSARAAFEALLAEEGLSERWVLQAMVEGDVRKSDLSCKLTHAHQKLAAQGCGTTIFIGSDCPELTFDSLHQALVTTDRDGKAFINPASDGGYVLVSVPAAASLATQSIFKGVEWSTAKTCASQTACLAREGFQVRTGECYSDIDEVEDLVLFVARRRLACTDWLKGSPDPLCPRMQAMVLSSPHLLKMVTIEGGLLE